MRSEDWKNTLDAMERELVADGLFFPGDVPPPPGVLRQPTRQEAEVGAVKLLFINEGRVALETLKSQCGLLRLFVHTDAATLDRRRQTHEHGIAWRPRPDRQ